MYMEKNVFATLFKYYYIFGFGIAIIIIGGKKYVAKNWDAFQKMPLLCKVPFIYE